MTGSGSGTTFNLLKTCAYTATIASSGPTNATYVGYDEDNQQFSLGTTQSFPSDTASGVMAPGSLQFIESWAINGFNDAPKPSDESGTFSLTLTFTAIPEPSSATLLAISAAVALCRRRQIVTR